MGHWYDRDGNPCHEVPYADPKKGMRSTTLADARKLDLVPSVTTVQTVRHRPGLERWKIIEHLRAAFVMAHNAPPQNDGLFIAVCMDLAKSRMSSAPDEGTEIHRRIEGMLRGEVMVADPGKPAVAILQSVRDWLKENEVIPQQIEHTFATKEYGGTVDLIGEWHGGRTVIIDWKTTTGELSVYPENCEQLVAYREGVIEADCDLVNVVLSRDNPGDMYVHHWEEYDIDRAWTGWNFVLALWQHDNKWEV